MTNEEKKEKARAYSKMRKDREYIFDCRGKDQFGCTKRVKVQNALCGVCKPKYAFKMREGRILSASREERRDYILGKKNARKEVKTYEKAYFLNKGVPKRRPKGFSFCN